MIKYIVLSGISARSFVSDFQWDFPYCFKNISKLPIIFYGNSLTIETDQQDLSLEILAEKDKNVSNFFIYKIKKCKELSLHILNICPLIIQNYKAIVVFVDFINCSLVEEDLKIKLNNLFNLVIEKNEHCNEFD